MKYVLAEQKQNVDLKRIFIVFFILFSILIKIVNITKLKSF